jgi:hypothetical protein
MWMWLAGGGVLLALIALVVVLVLVLGGGSKQGSPREAAVSYWDNINKHNYDAAYALLAPEIRAQTTVADLRQILDQAEAARQFKFTSVEATGENITGNTATVPLVMKTDNGQTANLTASLRKDNDKWFITNAGQPNIPTAP